MHVAEGQTADHHARARRQRDRRRALGEVLARLARAVAGRSETGSVKRAFEDALLRVLPVRTFVLRDQASRWSAEKPDEGVESVAFEVAGPTAAHRGLLPATFDRTNRLGEWEFQVMEHTAQLGALVLEVERGRGQSGRAPPSAALRPRRGAADRGDAGDGGPARPDRARGQHRLHGFVGRRDTPRIGKLALASICREISSEVALSPDGSRLAYVAGRRGEPPRIWIRSLDRVDAQQLSGTDGAYLMFWSPDGRALAFFAEGKLKKVDVAGGAPQTLCNIIGGRGGKWGSTGIIVFTGEPNSALSQVSAEGGPVTPATVFDPAQDPILHYWPQFLPDGRHFLYYQRSTKPEFQGVYVKSLDSAESTRILKSDLRAAYAQGHLLFVRDGLLFAQPFDATTLHLSGEPVRLAEGVGYYTGSFGYAAFDVSESGALAYGPAVSTSTALQWTGRDGTLLSTGPIGAFTSPRLAPDQKSVAMSVRDDSSASDVWTVDVARGIRTRRTFDPSTDWFPVWTPDGTRLIFGSTRDGATTMYVKSVTDGGAESRIEHQSKIGRTGAYRSDVSPIARVVIRPCA